MDIPKGKISDGYKKSKRQIESLLDSSQILYNSKQYATSLSLSILAREELAKLLVLQDHLKDGTKISCDEWKKLTKNTKNVTAHKFRLTYSPKVSREGVQKKFTRAMHEQMVSERKQLGLPTGMSYEQMMLITSEYEKGYEILDKIKQDCWYLGWDGKWNSLQIKLDANEIKGLAYINLNDTNSMYLSAISMRIHKQIRQPIKETLKDDPNFKKWLKFQNAQKEKEYEKMNKLATQALRKMRSA